MNPAGRRPMARELDRRRHRAWADGLPDVAVPTAVDDGGRQVTRMLPFSKEKIIPRAYRHTYAQRHADAGVDVTVLQELMNHRQVPRLRATTASAPGGAVRPLTG